MKRGKKKKNVCLNNSDSGTSCFKQTFRFWVEKKKKIIFIHCGLVTFVNIECQNLKKKIKTKTDYNRLISYSLFSFF